jgi:S-layer homology domain
MEGNNFMHKPLGWRTHFRPGWRLWSSMAGGMTAIIIGVIVVFGAATSAPAATVVTLNSGNYPNGFTVPAGQVWRFNPTADTTITSGGNIIVKGTLEMKPANSGVDHVLRFTGINESNFVGGGLDPIASDVGLWVMGAGRLDLKGETKTAWAYSWQSSWHSTDEVVAAPNTPGNYSFKTVTKATAPGKNALGYSTELMNLTRNVRIEGTPSGYTHVFIRSTVPSSIRYVALRYVGPNPGKFSSTDATGRYGIHIHMSGNGSRGTMIEGVVVRDTYNHAFVPHGSHGVTFKYTIAYHVKSEAYWWDEPADGVMNDTNDVVWDHAIAADVTMAPGGNNHRLTGFFLGEGKNPTITNSVAVGIQEEGGADRSGYLWPEDAESSWTYRNNRAHNNEANGIFVWQNNELPHVIDGYIAYYNKQAGISHGAYRNSYVYLNLTLLNNGTAIVSKALGKPDEDGSTDTQVWANVKTNGGTLDIGEHGLDAHTPVRFLNCDFGKVEVDDQGENPSVYDFINCGLEPSDFNLSRAMSNSVFRVQRSNGTAYRLTGSGSVMSIAKFFNGSVPTAPPVPGPVGPGGFTDTASSIFKDDIGWLASKGITKGCNPPANNKFCPDANVTRSQMAAFLDRAVGLSGTGKNYFTDDNGSQFEDAINRLAKAGVTKGCNPPANSHFCPDRFVTRGEMAAFLVRAFGYTNDGHSNYFTDDNNSLFEEAIDQLRVAGVTLGCNPPTNTHFCPNQRVTRGQMAAFLRRAVQGSATSQTSGIVLASAPTSVYAMQPQENPVALSDPSSLLAYDANVANVSWWCSIAS